MPINNSKLSKARHKITIRTLLALSLSALSATSAVAGPLDWLFNRTGSTDSAATDLPFLPSTAQPLATTGGAVRGSCSTDHSEQDSILIGLEPKAEQAILDVEGRPSIVAYTSGLENKQIKVAIGDYTMTRTIQSDGLLLLQGEEITTPGELDYTLRVICDPDEGASINDPTIYGRMNVVNQQMDLAQAVNSKAYFAALDEAVKQEDGNLVQNIIKSISPDLPSDKVGISLIQ